MLVWQREITGSFDLDWSALASVQIVGISQSSLLIYEILSVG